LNELELMRPKSEQPDDASFVPSRGGGRKPAQKLRPTKLRIVAGELGSRRIEYNGDLTTRPMKEKTREAVFSLLGGYLVDFYAIDLFAGTGILGFESISRGATGASLLELSRATVTTILANMRTLGLADCVDVQNVDTLRWLRSAADHTAQLPRNPWVVFCCPPFSMWEDQTDKLVDGLAQLIECAPEGSRLVCESEDKFDVASRLPQLDWDVRHYKPAMISIGSR
jgi:16S rRNA (guanine966-N2)-methyltransferase